MREKLNRAIALLEQADFLGDQVFRASVLRERLYERELIVSVIGQFKRGKSSLINALLGEELLPAGIIPLTAAVTEIRRGSAFRAVVCFSDGSEQDIHPENLPEYISEQKNPGNQKNVSMVKIWTEHIPFASGIVLADTPGVGSVHQHNTQTSHDYIKKSDAVLFLLSSDSPVSETERDFLLKARENAAKFYFAVNKTDMISEDNLTEFISYCKAVLSEAVGWDVSLYPLSARTGDGVPILAETLARDLEDSYGGLLEKSVSIKLDSILAGADTKLALYLKAAAIPAAELKEKLTKIRERQAELTAFSDEVQILTKQHTKRLVDRIREHLDTEIKETQTDAYNKAELLFEKLAALPPRQFEPKLSEELEFVMRERLGRLNEEGLVMLDEGYSDIVRVLGKKADETAQFVSDMVKEQFGLDCPVPAREFSVSERSDFFIRFSRRSGFLQITDAFVRILPKVKANRIIYERALSKMAGDLERSKNNMVYNYGYKMQESLRTMCGELAAEISRMNSELDDLLCHIEQSRNIRSEEFKQTEEKLIKLRLQLDELKETR